MTYPVKPRFAFAFTIHVLPAEIGVRHSPDLRHTDTQMQEVHDTADGSR